MKNYLNTLTLALALGTALGLSACNDALNLNPLDQISDAALWEDPALINAYLNDIYLGMRHGLYEVQLGSLVDETHFIHGYGTNEVVQSITSASAAGVWSNGRTNTPIDAYRWGPVYSRIRQVNILLQNIDDSGIEDEDLRNNVKGEAHFLRAYFYHNLLRAYGGVPIITEVYALDDDLLVGRNTFEETVDFIVAEAQTAADLLPMQPRNLGRATEGAALALKARVLLYAASDLYSENPANELVGYPGGDRTARWRAAKNAALDVMNMGLYQLYNRQGDPVENYTQLFLENGDHEEIIMSRFFLEERGDGYNPGLHNGPNGYRNWAGNTPIQQLVDDYEMADGTEFDWGNPEHAADPYENRDPRFYASILYDGAYFRPRPPEGAEIEPQGIIQTFEEVTLPDGSKRPGLDTRDGPIEDWNGGYSGYYLRKFIDPSINHSTSEKQIVPWRFFRYAEVLLNYAEASIGLGEEGDAREAINQIRRRAGMPDINDTGQALLERYRNERRIELVFEEHRYWDVRRWKIGSEVYEDAQGIQILAEATNYQDRSTYSNYQYDPIFIQDRGWQDRAYFVPIPNDEIQRNSNLVQNPDY